MADLTDKTDDIAIWDEGRTKSVGVITDASSVNRFATDALVTQSVIPSAVNSTSQALSSGSTFTGSQGSTLGVAAIQIVFIADQNCTVYCDQSGDGTNYDVIDTFNFKTALGGKSWTIQAVGQSFRVRVTNNGPSTTSYLRLNTVLCPIVEALPRTVDSEGNLSVCVREIEDPIMDVKVKVSPMNELRVATHVKIVGEDFDGSTLDTNFWVATNVGTGTATIAGVLTLATGATANSSSNVSSVRVGRYVGGSPNYYRGVLTMPAITGTNTRRWGAFTATDGFFFQYNGTTLSVVTRKASADTVVSSGSFNGEEGSTYAISTGPKTYEIYWTNSSTWFYVGSSLIHKVSSGTTMLADTLSLKVAMENVNSGGNTANNTMTCRTATINRIGQLANENTYKNISGISAGTVCKYGPGRLRAIISNAASGTTTIYDNTAASGTLIATIATQAGSFMYDVPFFTGLTIVTNNANSNVTVSYE